MQEMIDIADFAVGLSRQLYGLTMHSERPGHRMYEQWHPLGVVGVITAFNFPVAVWAWNAMIAAVCGDSVLWKPSPDTPLTAIAVQKIVNRVLDAARPGRASSIWSIGRQQAVGETPGPRPAPAADLRHRLHRDGPPRRRGRRRAAGPHAARTGRQQRHHRDGRRRISTWRCARCSSAPSAPPASAAPPRAASSCTRHRAPRLRSALVKAYGQVRIGDPLDEHTLMGPLINARAVDDMLDGAAQRPRAGRRDPLRRQARRSRRLLRRADAGARARRTCRSCRGDLRPDPLPDRVRHLDEAIALHNDVPQGLSSAIFTPNLRAPRRS